MAALRRVLPFTEDPISDLGSGAVEMRGMRHDRVSRCLSGECVRARLSLEILTLCDATVPPTGSSLLRWRMVLGLW